MAKKENKAKATKAPQGQVQEKAMKIGTDSVVVPGGYKGELQAAIAKLPHVPPIILDTGQGFTVDPKTALVNFKSLSKEIKKPMSKDQAKEFDRKMKAEAERLAKANPGMVQKLKKAMDTGLLPVSSSDVHTVLLMTVVTRDLIIDQKRSTQALEKEKQDVERRLQSAQDMSATLLDRQARLSQELDKQRGLSKTLTRSLSEERQLRRGSSSARFSRSLKRASLTLSKPGRMLGAAMDTPTVRMAKTSASRTRAQLSRGVKSALGVIVKPFSGTKIGQRAKVSLDKSIARSTQRIQKCTQELTTMKAVASALKNPDVAEKVKQLGIVQSMYSTTARGRITAASKKVDQQIDELGKNTKKMTQLTRSVKQVSDELEFKRTLAEITNTTEMVQRDLDKLSAEANRLKEEIARETQAQALIVAEQTETTGEIVKEAVQEAPPEVQAKAVVAAERAEQKTTQVERLAERTSRQADVGKARS